VKVNWTLSGAGKIRLDQDTSGAWDALPRVQHDVLADAQALAECFRREIVVTACDGRELARVDWRGRVPGPVAV
jgi:hypothetical protein